MSSCWLPIPDVSDGGSVAMLLDQSADNVPRDAHLKRWFLWGGVFGVVIALLLAVGLYYDAVSSGVVLQQPQSFLSVFESLNAPFRLRRHLLSATRYRLLLN